MTTPPVVSITDELIEELEGEIRIARAINNRAPIHPDDLESLLAERAELKQQLAAASPAAESYELFRQEAKRWRDIVRSFANEIPHRSAVRGNAPGHGHDVPGIWDSDNSPLAGKECAWCKTWHSALDAARNIGSGD